jgi:hypothetical protein
MNRAQYLMAFKLSMGTTRDPDADNMTCVLDALDECKETERGRMIRYLTDFYAQISRSSTTSRQSRLKFLVTSRPYDDIHRGFSAIRSNLPLIQLRSEDENDKISREIDLVIKSVPRRVQRRFNCLPSRRIVLDVSLLHRTGQACKASLAWVPSHLAGYWLIRGRVSPSHEGLIECHRQRCVHNLMRL